MAARLPNYQELIQAGINPATKLPIKLGGTAETLPDDILKVVRIVDEQDAVNRYRWWNLPDGLNSQLLERMLYYRGQLAMFYVKENDTFYILPFSKAGNIDVYGRYKKIVPLTFGGTKNDTDDIFLTGMTRNIINEVQNDEDLTDNDMDEMAVILYDYTPQLSQTILSRQVLNDPICKLEGEVLPLMRTSLIINTGIKGVRVNDADQQENVEIASASVEHAAKTGRMYVPVVGSVNFQDFANSSAANAQDYLMAMQSIDNFRLSTFGIENGGLFEKKAHMLDAEASINSKSDNYTYLDGLYNRQRFCDIVNSIWDLGIWCDKPEMEDAMINEPEMTVDPSEDKVPEGKEDQNDDTEL